MLDKVCCIIDVDGFSVRIPSESGDCYRNQFLVRELGYVRVDPVYTYLPRSYLFDLSQSYDFSRIPDAEAKTLRYQSRIITGLSLLPGPTESDCLDIRTLPDVLLKIYDRCRTVDADLVAYKGGCRESDLLKELAIPALDLQRFGCPAFKELMAKRNYKDCGHHKEVERDGAVHCSMAEVEAYRDWFMLNVRRYR
ncbi:hypothetical protein JTE90_009643 [Oedothorax gibbosus]|uniref:Exonuclease domain-containing protein n=1 Tax=Oedothorax gibbosus TaxID=931172 RepID=A0AAV6V9U1_9ARAC|nr:hypothetical protein JTE90_009643 [Oedothorax gibbosus]